MTGADATARLQALGFALDCALNPAAEVRLEERDEAAHGYLVAVAVLDPGGYVLARAERPALCMNCLA